MILDTNAISDYADGNPSLIEALRSSRKHSIPAIVLGEYRYGLARSRLKHERTIWINRLESEMEVLEITRSTARAYADVRNQLRAIGRPIPENDLWIAALAIEHGLSLLTRDSHFDYVSGLVRVNW